MKIADFFRMLSERLDEQDKKFEDLQLHVPRLADMGIQEGKSGELEGIATEVGGRIITPPEVETTAVATTTANDASVIDVSAAFTAAPPIAASPVSAATFIAIFGWSTATSFRTFHDRNATHRSPAGAGARGAVPAGESLAGIPWKLNPPVFSGDSVHFRSFEKEAIIFAEYVGFGHLAIEGLHE